MTTNRDTKNITIPSTLMLKEAIKRLNDTGEQILLVIDEESKLCGVLTDGDIRRYILHNDSLNVSVSEVMNKSFVCLKETESTRAKAILENNQFNHIPIVDKNGKIVDLVSALDFIKKRQIRHENPIVIMAGGKGTRLWPLTRVIPKPLIPVGEKTMIEIIIDNFKSNGFRKFYIIVNYKKEQIKSYFMEQALDDNIIFIEEEEYFGTAGGLSYLRDVIDHPFILSNCDILVKIEYSGMFAWHEEHEADMTILGVRKKWSVPYGTIKINHDNLVMDLHEKPNFRFLVNSGIYLLDPCIFELIPEKRYFDIDVLIRKAIEVGKKIACYPIEDGWYDVGQFEEYKFLLKQFQD